jgi:hypothetical protein
MYLLRTSIPMSRMSSAAASPLAVSEWVRSHTETMSMIYHAKYDKKVHERILKTVRGFI